VSLTGPSRDIARTVAMTICSSVRVRGRGLILDR
jgi:hypothetical protein